MNTYSVKNKNPEKDGFYPTNVGVLYYQGLWLTPAEDFCWEPCQHKNVTHWIDTPQNLNAQDCKWVTKPNGDLQLQTCLSWVGSVSKSELKEGLYYFIARNCGKTFRGWSESLDEAVSTVESLIKADENYGYNIIKKDNKQ